MFTKMVLELNSNAALIAESYADLELPDGIKSMKIGKEGAQMTFTFDETVEPTDLPMIVEELCQAIDAHEV